ncbi:HEAT repeat domain-containing protein [Dactylosporangium sp. NPDC050588]|uniref:HEAT repeat domain-containing protein n=1 Tax=Dactylosporangium sp. NPDC050588 TaxID=3157211 RepID=UPI0033C426B3
MTEPTDPHVTAAVDRGDVDWLAAHVDGTACPPALPARLARHGDPSLRLLAVQWLGARLIGGDVDEDLLRLLGTDEAPEVALATATLFQRHGRLPPSAWPRWREHGPVAVVRVAWLRAELLHLPGRLPAEPPGEPLLQAVAGLACADASDPPRLLDELTGRDDPVLHDAALRLCREGLRAAVLAPAAARRILGRLLDSGTPAVVAGALTELAEPWAAVDPVAPHRLRALLAPTPTGPGGSPPGVAGTADVASAAVAAAARHGLREPLLDAAADVRVPPRVRQRALEALGELLDREHIPAVVGLGTTDPLLLGPAAVACLTTMHHRGLIVAAADAAGVVGLALADHAIPAGDVAALLYTARHATRAALLAGPAAGLAAGSAAGSATGPAAGSVPGSSDAAHDGSGAAWARRLDLLVALARQGAPDLDIGGDVAALLPHAAEPEPFLAAIRALRHAPAEDAVLATLPRAPAAALHALEAVGGDRAVAVLADGLAQDLPFLRPWRHQALELCWLLQPDPARRHALLLRLDPAALPDRIAADLGRPDERELAVLRARATPDRPLQALIWLAGHAAAVDDVTELLGRIVAELALAYDTRGNPPDEQHRLPADLAAVDADRDRPAATKRMPVVPQEALAALQGLGRRLYRDGRIRPVCLLDAADHATGPPDTAGRVSGPPDTAGRVSGPLDAAGRVTGPHAAAGRVTDLFDADGRVAGPRDSAGRVTDLFDADGRVAGPRDSAGRVTGLRDAVQMDDAAAERAAGDAFAASVALDLLDRPGTPPTELAVLLELLERAPYERTRARTHRFLRHRDPHVRKHAVAVLARDGIEALAATLTPLTAAGDVQTVRQALIALGRAGARWAGHAVAACLEHPNMNIKKAAAEALRTTGTPATVPHLLGWLGRHDNPGLRAALTAALRAILADAADATVIAAFERTGELPLLESLDGALTPRSVAALTDQGSPAGPALLHLIAGGRLRLRDGAVASLAGRMAAHGITQSAAAAVREPHPDLVALTRDGWHATTARRVAAAGGDLPEALLPGLRRLLPDWLRLAAAEPDLRPSVLRLVVRCCPAPWTPEERIAFGRARSTVVTGVGELSHAARDALLAVLEDLAPHLGPAAALDVASRLRAAPPAPAGLRSTLATLRRCGAVLTRRDVERALADAALGADPWQAEPRVLREAFGFPQQGEALRQGPAPGNSSGVRSSTVESRECLAGLIEAWPATAADERPTLLDRMVALQPIGAPLWTLGEEAGRTGSAPRTPHDGDLDQPRSAALRDRLLTMLDHPRPGTTQRLRAAEALRSWPEPAIQRRLLQMYLHRDADLPPTPALARALTPEDLAADAPVPRLHQAMRLTLWLVSADLPPFVPALLRLRDHPDPSVVAAAGTALHRLPRSTAATLLGDPPAPLLLPEPAEPRLPAGLLDRPSATVRPPTRDELLHLARDGDATRIRVALAGLAETGDGTGLAELLGDLLRHPEAKVRLHAHRVSRQLLDRPTYLRHSEVLLADPQPDIVRAAVRAVSGAAWTPAIGAVVGLLLHPDPTVRRTAEAGLTRFGPAAAPALTKAAARARPDRRAAYTKILTAVTTPR